MNNKDVLKGEKDTGLKKNLAAVERFKLLIAIVDRGRGTKVVNLFRSHHLHFDFACLGSGTASSRILSFFGLDENSEGVGVDTISMPAGAGCFPGS